MAKKSELRELGAEALQDRLLELKADLAKEYSQIASGTRAEKPAKIRIMRRTIARILTIMNERKSQEAGTGSVEKIKTEKQVSKKGGMQGDGRGM